MSDTIVEEINEIKRQLEILNRQSSIVVEKLSADPAAENGKIYYNTSTNKYKVCENGVWKTLTSS